MSITAQSAIVGFGPQTAMESVATTWYRHRATMVDLDIQDEVREGPPEVGGIPVPTLPYKAGPIVAGGFTVQPRLQETLGWLLYGAFGDVDTDAAVTGSHGYDHQFEFVSGNESYIPWMSFRKHIPAADNDLATDLGQIMKDCKIVGLTLTLPNDGPVAARVDVLGRDFALDSAPSSWTWHNTMEPWDSIPISTVLEGYLKIAGAELPVVAATVGIQNVPLDLRQERVWGSPYLEDVTIVQRRFVFDLTVKYKNPQLYRSLLTGAASAVDTWSAHPYTGTFEVKAVSSVNMTGVDEPYSLSFFGTEVMMSQVGGITLAGNQSILMRFAGVALDTSNVAGYAYARLHNLESAYSWPAAS
jgi:hypothetical protein